MEREETDRFRRNEGGEEEDEQKENREDGYEHYPSGVYMGWMILHPLHPISCQPAEAAENANPNSKRTLCLLHLTKARLYFSTKTHRFKSYMCKIILQFDQRIQLPVKLLIHYIKMVNDHPNVIHM